MKLSPRLPALLLTAALLLPSALAAGEPAPATARQEDLDYLCTALEQTHPGFSTLAGPEFTARRELAQSHIPTATDEEFALDLQSLVAALGDSHTTTNLSLLSTSPMYPYALAWYEGQWFLQTAPAAEAALVGQPIAALGGLSMEEVVQSLSRLVSADNPVKLRRQAQQVLSSQPVLSWLGLTNQDGSLTLTTEGGDTCTLSPLTMEEMAALPSDALSRLSDQKTATAPTARDKNRFYFSLPLTEKVYYIQYNTCREDPENPMEDFAAQVAQEWAGGAYTTLLIDLRNNGGGSDGVLYPILEWAAGLVTEGHTVYALIGEATFSSAIINAVELKEIGAVLAGSPTSGSADHYGSTRSFSLPHSGLRVNCSTKFIHLADLFEAAADLGIESLTPDFAVEQPLSDTLSGHDTLVDTLLALEEPIHPQADPDSLLTRGGFARLLWQSAGSPAAGDCPFEDVFPLSPSLPALAWCAEANIAQGDEEGLFSPTRPITGQEAALFLHRHAGSPVPSGAPAPDAAPWAAQAVTWLRETLPLPADWAPGSSLTLSQAQTLLPK